MSVDTRGIYKALFAPEHDAPVYVPPLDIALDVARQTLAETAAANIHDDRAMLTAAVSLDMALRRLVAALDKEAGR
jgi:hypothetical protein